MQILFLIRDSHPKYTKNSHNSAMKRQTALLKNGPGTQMDILAKSYRRDGQAHTGGHAVDGEVGFQNGGM